ncbi:hypothetical protein BX616_000564 [Lobosporangium transversale]|uniref:Uncharacterized protein n=1 Tax=Lobosporangium transversale TaxID=64571 RepID=A0A1Y2GCU6_9FUNG|nr:hypothetical protein BCR41DRAFT_399748 [Lobosporangium transversale]KAF9906937.1 hypothetical protein BX616_000564 [Lobosporangium transversale]ORZ07251.1 hypothetical protein BCR41DRAFT_399748 [Lobosporangium transversale]|eukprot:XP_021877914.1 hypothetical protein BCR41DRAFT_399748 [Lobosporangium transversale]
MFSPSIKLKKILIGGFEDIRKVLDASNSGKDGEDDSEEREGGNEEKEGDDQVDIPAGHEVDFESLENGLNNIAVEKMRVVLCDDTEIIQVAKHYKVDPESRFITLTASKAEFFIEPERFDAWLLRHPKGYFHQFVLTRKYDNKTANLHRLTYECQCAGKKRVRKDRPQGGVAGKSRIDAPGNKQGCGAKT